MAMKPSALSCQTHILCQALPPQQKLLHLYCCGAHWFIAMFPGNICICAHDSMNIDQIAWKTSKPPPCLNEIFSPITETSFNFHCSCWHFNDTGFGLLTEHSETSLSFPSFFFFSLFHQGAFITACGRCTPLCHERGAEARRDGCCRCVSSGAGQGQQPERNHSIKRENEGPKKKA